MRHRRKQSLIEMLILLLLCLGMGYAFLTTSLSLNGTAHITNSSWNVYWDSVYYIGPLAIPQDQILQEATIDSSKTTVSFEVNLKEPGDAYSFGVIARNSGTMDAEIDSIQLLVNGEDISHLPSYLSYYFSNVSLQPIEVGQFLKAGETTDYLVGVQYRDDINPEDLPDTDATFTFSFGVTYVQMEGDIEQTGAKVYTASNGGSATIGYKIPDEIKVFSDYSSAIANFGYPVFLRHTLTDRNFIYSSYAGFERNGNVYYFKGGDGGISFTDNKNLLSSIFDSSYCNMAGYYMECMDGSYRVYCNNTGEVIVSKIYDNTIASCSITSYGSSYCNEEPYGSVGD